VYNFNDTIAAVSSPTSDHRVILRLSGPQTIDILNQIFSPAALGNPGITQGIVLVTKDINLDSVVYLFRQPHSYTGDDLAEIHLWANPAVTEQLLERLLSLGTRPASPGEFTARAYLNGKIDLAQAEAVNEVITASNTFQLAAAENLLAGRFGQTLKLIRSTILDCLSRLEAGLDFSTEDIGPTNQTEIITALDEATNQLRELLAGSINSESTLDLPAVGIAGAPNAGKSTLLNKLLGRQRSIVSHQRKTTRDILTGETDIHGCRCILFDCAGLTTNTETILDELTQQAAIQALRNALVVTFCVDIAKQDWSEDLAVWNMFRCHCERSEAISLIAVATKTDLLALPNRICHSERSEESLASQAQTLRSAQGDSFEIVSERISKLKSLFGCDFLPISAHSDTGIDKLKAQITERIITVTPADGKYSIALTARHRQAVTTAIANLEKAVDELKAGNEEVAAMMLRTSHSQLSNIEQQNIDEQLLDRIFSRFCIGK
jgi:tRNA modification GTPase